MNRMDELALLAVQAAIERLQLWKLFNRLYILTIPASAGRIVAPPATRRAQLHSDDVSPARSIITKKRKTLNEGALHAFPDLIMLINHLLFAYTKRNEAIHETWTPSCSYGSDLGSPTHR